MKSLIIYATKYGCTEKTAEMLKSKMSCEVQIVNVMKEKVPPLDSFDSVILGGSIYMGKVQKELTDYISGNLPVLLKKKVGLFICAGSPDIDARKKELETAFPQELYAKAAAKELFGYEIIFNKLNFFHKMITKAMKGDRNDVSEINEAAIASLAKAVSC